MAATPHDHAAAGDGRPAAAFHDLVVIGAGMAGLNALHAAVPYLPKGAQVLLVDRKEVPGGMWNTAYGHVRLHQPHAMFTVGDIPWNWTRPQSYLATGREVRDHLAHGLAVTAQAVDLRTCFGHTSVACEEVGTASGYRARVTFHSNGSPERTETVEAARVIHAAGLDYYPPVPLRLSSADVLSITPHDLREALSAHPGAPVYVVGGGKTGMDTIAATLAHDPHRKVSLINGRGTNFLNRTRYFPTGVRRWTSGKLISRIMRDTALRFDGDNEEEMMHHFRRHHSVDPAAGNGVYLYGLLSEDEHGRIVRGLSRTWRDYLVDVTDTPGGPCMVLRHQPQEPVKPGSIFVNCTGSFFRTGGMTDRLPCLSPQDTVVRVNLRDGFYFLSSVAAFMLTHLLYRDALRGKGFYTLDHEVLFRRNRNAWVGASAAQAYMNQVLAVQILPAAVLSRCGLDLDRWYPLPRRLAGLLRMKASAGPDIAHCRAVLDRIADRFAVHCAPVNRGPPR